MTRVPSFLAPAALAAVLAVAACVHASPIAPELRDPDPATLPHAFETYRANRAAWVRALAATVAESVRRRDTDHPVFHGCYDWHSAVHGHYALLAAARITGDSGLRAIVDASLGPEGIERERRKLLSDPTFEMPYGRAWFLRLAIEDRRVTGSPRLDAMARDVAASLLAWLRAHPPSPESSEYESASWALRQLHDHCQATGDDECLRRVRAAVQAGFTQARPTPALGEDFGDRPGFFSRWVNWSHLLAAAAPHEQVRAMLTAFPPSPADLSPPTRLRTVHHLGIEFSRAWGLWSAWSVTGDPIYRDAAAKHIAAGMRLHEGRRSDYRSWGHWVPQFGIHAMSIADPGPSGEGT